MRLRRYLGYAQSQKLQNVIRGILITMTSSHAISARRLDPV
jgi:hypothetical protein